MAVNFDTTKNAEKTTSFLSFKLSNEFFAINVIKIIEILEVPKITRVPHAPEYLIGVVNLRGGVLPVIDTRIKFGLESTEFTVNTCIIVLNININDEDIIVGALVDSVSEVFEIDATQIQPSPSIGSKYRADFIEGMIKENDQFMMLLNIDKVFSASDLESIKVSQDELVLMSNN
jgi:purine-binding chemotaxis protein CheW